MPRSSQLLLRIAIAFAFLYPAIAGILHPDNWADFFPQFVRGTLPDSVLLLGWGILEILIALWILSGWKVWLPSFAAAALLCGIVLFNLPLLDIVFRDLSLALAALALAVESYRATESSA